MLFEFCIPLHSVHQAQQDLFATASALSSCPLPRVGTPPARAAARPLTPACAGPPARGPDRWRGPSAGGPLTAHGASWECEIVPWHSVPSLRSLLPCPAPSRSMVRRLNSVRRPHSRRSIPTISLQQRSTPVTYAVRKDLSVI